MRIGGKKQKTETDKERKKRLKSLAMSSSSEEEDSTVTAENLSILERNEWKEKIPFLYDFIVSHSLPSHSNTVDWSSLSPPLSLSLSIGPFDPYLLTLLFNMYLNSSRSFLTIAKVLVPTSDSSILIRPKVCYLVIVLCVSRTNLYYVLC